MPGPDRPTTPAAVPAAGSASDAAAAAPQYPQVRVRVTGATAHILIGKVAVALRRQVGDAAADTFNTAAQACRTRQQVLDLVRATVKVR